MIRSLTSVLRIPELRRKLLFTVLIIAVYRLGAYVPIPGTHPGYLKAIAGAEDFAAAEGDGGGGFGGYLNFIARITGGSFEPFLFALGIMPYISASIILQLLTQAIPSLERLVKEGEAGRKKINEYTRYLTVLLCIVQGSFISHTAHFHNGGWRGDHVGSFLYYLVCVVAMTSGTVFLMWLGELIDDFGIGNGISLIIMAGIVDRLPAVGLYLSKNMQLRFSFQPDVIGIEKVLLILLMFVGVIIAVVAITQAQRRIPIQQAKHTRGRRVYGGQRQYLPLRVNQAGVIPVIFASSLLMLPMYLFDGLRGLWNNAFTRAVSEAFRYGSVMHLLLYVGLIYLFCYFWTAIQFQPKEMADNLRDWGSFIPGRRPGASTAFYLERVMNRITYVGAGFLAVIAIIPMVVSHATNVNMIVTGFLGGTGLLIIVSVALDVVQRIESHLIMRHYEGFLAEGRVRGRRG
jgi:preprotein translocase subunit SecY